MHKTNRTEQGNEIRFSSSIDSKCLPRLRTLQCRPIHAPVESYIAAAYGTYLADGVLDLFGKLLRG